MTLPDPSVTTTLPLRIKLTEKSYNAILDDDQVEYLVRLEVLRQLEASSSEQDLFSGFCEGEQFLGDEIVFSPGEMLGRAVQEAGFIHMVARGYTGSVAKTNPRANKRNLEKVKKASLRSPPAGLMVFRVWLRDTAPLLLDPNRVCWYYGPSSRGILDTLESEDLVLSLALPDTDREDKKIPYVVMRFNAGTPSLEPHRPRFTDALELRYLEYWRPGGLTAPWALGLSGLPEVVGRATVLCTTATGISFISCKHQRRA